MGKISNIRLLRNDEGDGSSFPDATLQLFDEARAATVGGDVSGAILILIRRSGSAPIMDATDAAVRFPSLSQRLLDEMSRMVSRLR